MEKITLPHLGTIDEYYFISFFKFLSRINGEWHHFDLTEEEHMKIKPALMTAIRDFFSSIEYTEPRCCIRQEHRSFDSDDQERFYRNMWSHQKD